MIRNNYIIAGIVKYGTTRYSIMIISIIIGIYSTYYGKFKGVDNFNSDMYHNILGERYLPKSTLIVSLDSDTIDLLPNTPLAFWGPHFSKAIDKLQKAGASAIALDFQFLITPDQWLSTFVDNDCISKKMKNYDQSFDNSLSKGLVILGAKPIRNKYNMITVSDPPFEYLESLYGHRNSIGLTILIRDSDAVVREFSPSLSSLKIINNNEFSAAKMAYDTPDPWLTYAALAVKKSLEVRQVENLNFEVASNAKLIKYSGPPGTVPRLSLSTFLRDKELSFEEKQLISGRIVFIGADEDHFGDRQRTPYSRQFLGLGHRDMNSVEIHANIAETILSATAFKSIPLWITAIFIWTPCMIAGIYISDKSENMKKLGIIDLIISIIIWLAGLILFYKGFLLSISGLFYSMSLYFLFINIKNIIINFNYKKNKYN